MKPTDYLIYPDSTGVPIIDYDQYHRDILAGKCADCGGTDGEHSYFCVRKSKAILQSGLQLLLKNKYKTKLAKAYDTGYRDGFIDGFKLGSKIHTTYIENNINIYIS